MSQTDESIATEGEAVGAKVREGVGGGEQLHNGFRSPLGAMTMTFSN